MIIFYDVNLNILSPF